jgi:hypothetical protein
MAIASAPNVPVFDDIKPGTRLRGLGERLVYLGEETSFEFIEAGRTYAFDADAGLLRLASEAYRTFLDRKVIQETRFRA